MYVHICIPCRTYVVKLSMCNSYLHVTCSYTLLQGKHTSPFTRHMVLQRGMPVLYVLVPLLYEISSQKGTNFTST